MGILFGKRNSASLSDKVKMVFTDAKAEGEKKGYEKAANQYEEALEKAQSFYNEIEDIVRRKKGFYQEQSKRLSDMLTVVQYEKKQLENELDLKIATVSEKYNIPVEELKMGRIVDNVLMSVSQLYWLDLVYNYKENKMYKAEQEGYKEAQKSYRTKILNLKSNLRELQKEADTTLQETLEQIVDLVILITSERMEIAELKMALEE